MKKIIIESNKIFLAFVIMISLTACSADAFDIGSFFTQLTNWSNYSTDEINFGSPNKYYFGLLNDDEKKAYNSIVSNVEKMPEKIEIPKITSKELKTVFEAVLNDNPQFIFLGHTCTFEVAGKNQYFKTDYIISKQQYEQEISGMISAAEKIKNKLTGKSDYAKELYVHDYIIKKCTYEADEAQNSDTDKSTAYGGLVSGRASCEGYSKAFKYVLDYLGIQCYIAAGEALADNNKYSSHMWNVVKIEDELYFTDVTWDDSDTTQIYYDYFNITTAQLFKDHKDCSFSETCSAKKNNYFVKENIYLTSFGYADKNKIKHTIKKSINAKKYYFSVKCSNKAVYKKCKASLVSNKNIYSLVEEAVPSYKNRLNKNGVVYYENSRLNIITFTF